MTGSPADGHSFRFYLDMRGSHGLAGQDISEYTDAKHWDSETGMLRMVEVRAWNLRDALKKVQALPFGDWFENDLPPNVNKFAHAEAERMPEPTEQGSRVWAACVHTPLVKRAWYADGHGNWLDSSGLSTSADDWASLIDPEPHQPEPDNLPKTWDGTHGHAGDTKPVAGAQSAPDYYWDDQGKQHQSREG